MEAHDALIAFLARKSQQGQIAFFSGADPAGNMRERAIQPTKFYRSQNLDGRFEEIPLASALVDYSYSIFAFLWTTHFECFC